MVNPVISQVKSTIASFIEYHDLALQNNGVNVTETVYGPTSDRKYDVRTGASVGINVQMINDAGSAQAFDFTIESTNRAYDNLDDIPESDWEELQAEVNVPIGTKSAQYETVRATPLITAIRIRIKVASGDADVFGRVGYF